MATACTSGEPSGHMRLPYIREGDEIMTETLPIIHVISDSWMHKLNLIIDRVDLEALIKYINIAPHRVALSIRPAESIRHLGYSPRMPLQTIC